MWYKWVVVLMKMKGLVMRMKRVAATILSVVLAASTLIGCGNSGEENLKNVELSKYVTNIGDYKGLELTGYSTEITDEYLQSYVDYMFNII